jgi:CRISPR-associated protein Csh1
MLEAMRRLALDYLWIELDGGKHPDPEAWYRELRQHDPGRLFPKLVEDVEESGNTNRDTQRYYTLRADPASADTAILEVHEFQPGDAEKLPFNQPSGSQSAALGPVIKRTFKTKEAGPSVKIQETTLNAFAEIAGAKKSWSDYFQQAHSCFRRKALRFGDKEVTDEAGAFRSAVRLIDEKRTVLLAFQDAEGRLPGKTPEYVDYLQSVLARTKYATGQNGPRSNSTCVLCGESPVDIFPNALRGAGVNLANLDRDGAFPGVDSMAAWKGYSLCVACADLLYVYCRHVAAEFLVTVASERALVIPETTVDPSRRREFIKRIRELARGINVSRDEVPLRENKLLRLLSDDNAVTTLTFLWADFGNRIEDIQGVVTDVLPSRLHELIKLNQGFAERTHPLFPRVALEGFDYDLALNILRPLLRRPGDKKAQAANDSRRLFELRRDLAEAVYRSTKLPERFWNEVHLTARWHWDEICNKGNTWDAIHEGFSTKKNEGYLTLAGWVRQLARFLAYLRHVGVVMPLLNDIPQPGSERLKPYFTEESAIDSKEKAFVFILGVLYGKLLAVQAARRVNVSANALTWLRRLSLSGKDMPDLYRKVYGKILEYGRVSRNEGVLEILEELGLLGTQVRHSLDETMTCYFLLLGMSLANRILPRQPSDEDETEGDDQ